MIKAIIFDFGGPIVEWREGFEKTYSKYEELKGLESGAIHNLFESYTRGAMVGDFSSVTDFFEKTKPAISLNLDELNMIYDEANSLMSLRPEIEKYIVELKKKYQIGLLSNFTSGLEKYLQEVFNISSLFDVVVSSYDVKMRKPDPRIYQHTLEKLKVSPQETVFIDDLKENVEGALSLGINSVLFNNSEQCIADLNNVLEEDDV
ncbi:MAG: HAD family phosphatase [Candidatus Falkowbacteria bacterium]|nr:HAD family phosphatase [Candidatus Falkowbacteria bacterium]